MPELLLDDATAHALLRRQDTLQHAATAIIADLDLGALLAPYGEMAQVGSSAMGLLVQPDIDISVTCDALDVDRMFAAARPLAAHPRVRSLRWVNEAGAFQPAGLMEGLYWGIQYEAADATTWKIDLWFWTRGADPGNRAYVEDMLRRLTPQTRLAILWLKEQREQTGAAHPSVLIYEAVLDHGVRSPAEFEAWLRRRS